MARFGINMAGPTGKPSPALLNARLDGMQRSQFRTHFLKQGCVTPAEGFCEWREEGGTQPYFFGARTASRSCLRASGKKLSTSDRRIACAILTEERNELVASYHDRMPLAPADDSVAEWLDLSQQDLLTRPVLLDLNEFTVRPMNRAMKNVRQKELAAIDPEAEAA